MLKLTRLLLDSPFWAWLSRLDHLSIISGTPPEKSLTFSKAVWGADRGQPIAACGETRGRHPSVMEP